MAILLTRAGRVELARAFFADIRNAHSYFYFALGKTTAWADEEAPPTPIDSEIFIKDFRKNIMLTQSISSPDICHLARRIDWTSGTVYDPYDDSYSPTSLAPSGAQSLADANFYVMTDENKVYKCIDNNSNAQSITKPTSTSTNTVILADGYNWKFLFQVSSSDQTKFLDAAHIPVRKLTTTPYGDVNGEIDSITVTNGGSGYDPLDPPTVVINGDGKVEDNDGNPIPLARATAVVTGDAVTSITVDEAGSGYTFANISFSGEGGGSGATADALLGDTDNNPGLQQAVENSAIGGALDRIVLISGGQDYVEGDLTIKIVGDGTGAEATAEIAAGSGTVTGINLTVAGSDYTFANIVFVQNGIGTLASARAVISPIDGHGNNPVKELFSTTVGITSSFDDNANTDLFLENDFRQIGLIKNIREFSRTLNNTNVYTNLTGTPLYAVHVDSSADYALDDIVTTDSDGSFRVIQIRQVTDTGTGAYRVFLQGIISSAKYALISSSSILNNQTQSKPNLVINSCDDPEVDTATGDVVYIENRPTISRSADQVETIKALVNF